MRTSFFLFATTALVLPTYALAQAQPDSSAVTLEEIVVTAQKRAENPKDVPISITAFNEEQIQKREIRDLYDVAKQTPNFFQSKTGGRGDASTLNMRGVSSANADFANPTVGLFVDGVKRSGGYDLDFFDTERVEVLRGPQGTLYGGNSLGGAINIINKRPSFNWESGADFTVGRFATFQERGYVSGPISDTLAFRLTGSKLNSDGFITNTFLNQAAETRNDFLGRAQLRWTPTPDWDINLNISGFNYDGRFATYAPISSLKVNPWKSMADLPGSAKQYDFSQILDANYTGDGYRLTSISAHRFWRSVEFLDVDYTGLPLATDRAQKRNESWSQEFRIASDGPESDRFKWLLGTYVSRENQFTGDNFYIVPPLFGVQEPTASLSAVGIGQNNAAVFGQATYGLTDQLFATVGLRYDYVTKGVNSGAAYVMPSGTYPGGTTEGSRDFKALLPKFALEYRWTPEISTYATISRGYKPGGFQTYNAPNANVSYDSQYMWNYEVGVKAAMFENRVVANLSAFYIDLQDEQFALLVRPNVAVLQNIGRSHSQGFEADLNWSVTPEWSLFGSVGYVEAQVDKLDPGARGTFVGARPAYVPQYTATIGTDYRFSNGVYIRVDNQFIGEYFLDFSNQVRQGPFSLLNAKVGYAWDNYDVSVFGRNLLNQAYLTRAFGGTLDGQGYVGRQGEPLFVGAVFRVKL